MARLPWPDRLLPSVITLLKTPCLRIPFHLLECAISTRRKMARMLLEHPNFKSERRGQLEYARELY